MGLRIDMFGGLQVTKNGEKLELHGVRQRALVGYLALSPHDFSRAHLAGLLWPDVSDDEARHSLRQCLSVIRRDLGPAAALLMFDNDRIGLDPARYTTDVARFYELSAGTKRSDWRAASTLYSGELLAGIDLDGTAAPLRKRRSRS
jgi:DNA-binding SARP family transcriptional activator